MPIYKTKEKKDGQAVYRVIINYTNNKGEYKKKEKKAVGLANAKMVEMQLLGDNDTTSLSPSGTFADLYNLYIANKSKEIRETSLRRIETNFNNHILEYFSKYKIKKINIQIMNEWKTEIYNKNLSNITNKGIYSSLRNFFNYLVKNEYINSSPMKNLDNFKNPLEINSVEKIRYYTKEEFVKYIDVAKTLAEKTKNYNYYVFFAVAYYTGMRKGEINALCWFDIDSGYINVRRSIAQKLKGEDRETPPKNKSSYRTLQMPLPLINILDKHKARQRLKGDFKEDYRVCGGNSCLRDSTIDVYNRKYSKLAGLQHISVHEFRHSHASLLANNGINIQEIARRLGHSKIEITWNTYSHLYPREEERAIKILNDIV